MAGSERQKRMAATNGKFGIRINCEKGSDGWIVGKDSDVMLFQDRKEATSALAKLKRDDRYSWNCEAAVTEFTGWGK